MFVTASTRYTTLWPIIASSFLILLGLEDVGVARDRLVFAIADLLLFIRSQGLLDVTA